VDPRPAGDAGADPALTELEHSRRRVVELEAEVRDLRGRLDALESEAGGRPSVSMASAWNPRLFAVTASSSLLPAVNRESPPAAKVALYRSLFVGRDDVYAYRWENPDGRKGWAPARPPGWRRSGDQGVLPLTDGEPRIPTPSPAMDWSSSTSVTT